jgi:hypothetical protein
MSTSEVVGMLDKYRRWYRETYVPKMLDEGPFDGVEDFEEHGWDDPLGALQALESADIVEIEKTFGPLPRPYKELITLVGVGPLICAYDEEPIPFHIIHPSELGKTRADAMSWLSEADARLARSTLDLDPDQMLPFMTDDGRGTYFMLTRQTDDDDRVVLFDHAYEQGHPFGRSKSFMGFLERWIGCAMKLNPLNPFDGL